MVIIMDQPSGHHYSHNHDDLHDDDDHHHHHHDDHDDDDDLGPTVMAGTPQPLITPRSPSGCSAQPL